MYEARRVMAGPAITFSLIAPPQEASGAMTATRPHRRRRPSTIPRTPAKWSTWLWV